MTLGEQHTPPASSSLRPTLWVQRRKSLGVDLSFIISLQLQVSSKASMSTRENTKTPSGRLVQRTSRTQDQQCLGLHGGITITASLYYSVHAKPTG